MEQQEKRKDEGPLARKQAAGTCGVWGPVILQLSTSDKTDRPGPQVFSFPKFVAEVNTRTPRTHFIRLLALAAARSGFQGIRVEEIYGCSVLRMVPLCALSSTGYKPANDPPPPLQPRNI